MNVSTIFRTWQPKFAESLKTFFKVSGNLEQNFELDSCLKSADSCGIPRNIGKNIGEIDFSKHSGCSTKMNVLGEKQRRRTLQTSGNGTRIIVSNLKNAAK